MIVLSCSNLYKSFATIPILENISFSLNHQQKVGLIGRNGSGKTTLFKILTGELEYDQGNIFHHKDSTLGYLKQADYYGVDVSLYDFCLEVFHDVIAMEKQLRVYEHAIAEAADSADELQDLMKAYSRLTEAFNSINGYAYQSEVRGILFGLGFKEDDFSRPIHQFSGGQQSRISIAKLLLKKPEILLLDEPTNHLDMEAVRWLEGFLKNYPGALILISHDRYFLDQVVDHVIEIENHNLLQNPGNYSDFLKFKETYELSQARAFEQQQKYIKSQESLIQKFKERGTEKLAKRARSREKRLSHFESMDDPYVKREKAKLAFSPKAPSGTDVLFVEDLKKDFDEQIIFENISFNVYKGEKIGIIGRNGVGKTTLFKIILDETYKSGGQITYGHNVNVGYYRQDQDDLNIDLNMIEVISEDNPKMTETEIRTRLGAFLFKGEDVFKPVSALSGGEKSRLSLLKLMLSKANVLLLDEPTNHLDILSKEALEDALMSYEGTMIVISHDRYFLNKVTKRIIELTPTEANDYIGNYDAYLEKKMTLEALEVPFESSGVTKTQIRDQRKKEKEKLKEIQNEKKAFQALEDKIHFLEGEVERLEHELCLESVYSDPEQVKALTFEINQIKIDLESLYETWENYI
jgi:ATP-binding cassette subfamily F protein 3